MSSITSANPFFATGPVNGSGRIKVTLTEGKEYLFGIPDFNDDSDASIKILNKNNVKYGSLGNVLTAPYSGEYYIDYSDASDAIITAAMLDGASKNTDFKLSSIGDNIHGFITTDNIGTPYRCDSKKLIYDDVTLTEDVTYSIAISGGEDHETVIQDEYGVKITRDGNSWLDDDYFRETLFTPTYTGKYRIVIDPEYSCLSGGDILLSVLPEYEYMNKLNISPTLVPTNSVPATGGTSPGTSGSSPPEPGSGPPAGSGQPAPTGSGSPAPTAPTVPATGGTSPGAAEPTPVPVPSPTLTGDPPNLIKATLRGKEINLQFDNLLSPTLPSSRKFTLYQNNREYIITNTQVFSSDGIVVLTAEKELDPTVSLSLGYLDFPGDQTQGVVESQTGVDLESFSDFAINNQGSQLNLISIEDGEFEGNQITLFLSDPISSSLPSARRFKVKSASKKQKILAIATEPEEGIVVITTKKNLDLQKTVFVTYSDLSGDQVDKVIEDVAGNDMATIKNFEIVSGGNDAIAPMVSSATLDENTLSVEFDSIIRNTSISKNRFKVKVNGKKVRVLSATVEEDDSYVELALKPKNLRTIDIESSVTLSYKDPKGDQTSKVVEDLFGNDLNSFTGFDVDIVKI